MRLLYSILFILLLCCCNSSFTDNDYFAGEINLIKDSLPVKDIQPESIEIDGIYKGPIFVYDSLLIYYPMNFTATSSYEVYNLNNKSLLGKFCNRGGGPNEIISLTLVSHFYTENGDLKTLLYGGNEKKLVEWNISKSLAKQTTVFDQVVPYDWDVDSHVIPYNKLFRISSDTIWVTVPSTFLTIDNELISLPVYEKRTISTNRQVQKYDIFYKIPENNGDKVQSALLSPERFLESFYCMKPDGSKIVQAMLFMPQVNILDLRSGGVEGFRINPFIRFSTFKENIGKINYNFTSVAVDDRFIYALYWGRSIKDKNEKKQSNIVYVFDWEGNLVNKLGLGKYVEHIFLDEKNHILYGREYTSDYVYAYDLNAL